LGDGRITQEGEPLDQPSRVKGPIAEEIVVHGLPMSKMECNGGTAIKDELFRNGVQFVPQSALRRGQNTECGLETASHRRETP
jgi:hypothetical protein